MQLDTNQLQDLCDIAIEAANKAGRYIFSNHQKDFKVKTKTGVKSKASQVVTEVDINSQKIIVDTLQESIKKFDLGILTEESDDNGERLEKDYFWCVDPLDGTLPFTEGKTGYSVAISLIALSGDPVIGVIYDPVRNKLYHAIKGFGVFRNKEKWVIKTKITNNLNFYYNRSFKKLNTFSAVIENLEKFADQKNLNQLQVEQAGGAIMNAITALENTPSCFFALPKNDLGGGSFWDYAPTACIYIESGLPVTDIFGKPLNFNKPETTFMNHCGVLFASSEEIAIHIQDLYKKL